MFFAKHWEYLTPTRIWRRLPVTNARWTREDIWDVLLRCRLSILTRHLSLIIWLRSAGRAGWSGRESAFRWNLLSWIPLFHSGWIGGPITGTGVIPARIWASGDCKTEIRATNEVQGLLPCPLAIQTAIEIRDETGEPVCLHYSHQLPIRPS